MWAFWHFFATFSKVFEKAPKLSQTLNILVSQFHFKTLNYPIGTEPIKKANQVTHFIVIWDFLNNLQSLDFFSWIWPSVSLTLSAISCTFLMFFNNVLFRLIAILQSSLPRLRKCDIFSNSFMKCLLTFCSPWKRKSFFASHLFT